MSFLSFSTFRLPYVLHRHFRHSEKLQLWNHAKCSGHRVRYADHWHARVGQFELWNLHQDGGWILQHPVGSNRGYFLLHGYRRCRGIRKFGWDSRCWDSRSCLHDWLCRHTESCGFRQWQILWIWIFHKNQLVKCLLANWKTCDYLCAC